MKKLIKRAIEDKIIECAKTFPVIMLYGPRQVGKSTLFNVLNNEHKIKANEIINLRSQKIELELALNDPNQFIKNHPWPIIIDEIQLAPTLFERIYAEVEKERMKTKGHPYGMYFLTGSESIKLIKGVKESLAGRVALLEMNTLSNNEIYQYESVPFIPNTNKHKRKPISFNDQKLFKRIFKGGYPELYKNSKIDRDIFFESYIETYIEKDVSEIITIKDKMLFRKFLRIVAARTGNELICNNVAQDVGVDLTTVKRWISVLESTKIIYLLQPFNDSAIKRVTKRPIIYMLDTGLCCYLASINDPLNLSLSVNAGPLFQTFIVSEIIKSYINSGKKYDNYFYWIRTNGGSEIDFIIFINNKLYPIEIKKTTHPNKMMVDTKILSKTKYKVETNAIVCNIDEKMVVSDDLVFLPITEI